MFTMEAYEAKWTLDAEVHQDGLMIARLAYAQMQDGYIVEAGGWGGRNNLEVVIAGLKNLTGVLVASAIHTVMDEHGQPQTHWAAVTRVRYGKGRGLRTPSDTGDDLP